jgi:hypothetical protein
MNEVIFDVFDKIVWDDVDACYKRIKAKMNIESLQPYWDITRPFRATMLRTQISEARNEIKNKPA